MLSVLSLQYCMLLLYLLWTCPRETSPLPLLITNWTHPGRAHGLRFGGRRRVVTAVNHGLKDYVGRDRASRLFLCEINYILEPYIFYFFGSSTALLVLEGVPFLDLEENYY